MLNQLISCVLFLLSIPSQPAKAVVLDLRAHVDGDPRVELHTRIRVVSGAKDTVVVRLGKDETVLIDVHPVAKDEATTHLRFVVRRRSGDQEQILGRPDMLLANKARGTIEQRIDTQRQMRMTVAAEISASGPGREEP